MMTGTGATKSMIPLSMSPDNRVMNKTVDWGKSDSQVKKEFLPRLVYVVGGSALAFASLIFNLAAFLVKLPVTLVRVTFGQIKTKNGKFSDRFPADTTAKALFMHAYKIAICLVDIILTPTLGLAHPRAHNWVHMKMHVLIPHKEGNSGAGKLPHDPDHLQKALGEHSKKGEDLLNRDDQPVLPLQAPELPMTLPLKNVGVEARPLAVIRPDALRNVALRGTQPREDSPSREEPSIIGSLNNSLSKRSHLLEESKADSFSELSDEEAEGDEGDWAVNTQTFTRRQAQELAALRQKRMEQERISQEKIEQDRAAREAEARILAAPQPVAGGRAADRATAEKSLQSNLKKRRSRIQDTLLPGDAPKGPNPARRRGQQPGKRTAMELYNDLRNSEGK